MAEIKVLTVSQMVRLLSAAYSSLIEKNVPLRQFPSVMLWGAPGVGKSQGVRQLAAQIEEKTGRSVHVTDVRLLLFNPVDLRGIPTANSDRTLAVWLRPKIFQMDARDDVVNILFLDEISAAPQSVQAAAYQITLDRTVGEHRLPENCIVIAAGNRVTDRSVAYTMPKALANRLCHVEIRGDLQSWRSWAVRAGVHPLVLGFLDYRPNLLMDFDAQAGTLAFPTPRSWEMVSNILNHVSADLFSVMPLICGCIGEDAASQLLAWSEVYQKIPNAAEILSGREKGVPTRPEVLYALASGVISYTAGQSCTEAEISNLVQYALQLPPEFRDKIFYDLLALPQLRTPLQKNARFSDWFLRKGLDWDDL